MHGRADNAPPPAGQWHLPPENQGNGSTVNIVGGSIIDVARDYRYYNHGVVNQRISIHNSQPG